MAAQIDFLSRSKLEYPAGAGRMAFIDQASDTRSERFNFLDQAWIRMDRGVVVRTGGFLSSDQGRQIQRVQLPEVGDMVYRGLPLAALIGSRGAKHFIPSPVSGRILEVNRGLAKCPDHLWRDPCNHGWITQVQPSELFQDMLATRKRTVILAGANRKPNPELHQRLTQLGCRVIAIRCLDHVFQLIRDNQARVLVLDAGNYAQNVVQVIKWFSFAAPEVKIVLAGSSGIVKEAVSFANHSVPYPLEPFNDTSIADTLQACFTPATRRTRGADDSAIRTTPIQRLRISRGWNIWVSLFVSGQALRQHEGLENELCRLATRHDCIVQSEPGLGQATYAELEREANRSVRVLVVDIHDSGRIPGTLTIQSPADSGPYGSLPEGKLLNLQVQPAGLGFKQEIFDPHTTRALAQHVFTEISYELGLSPEEESDQSAVTH